MRNRKTPAVRRSLDIGERYKRNSPLPATSEEKQQYSRWWCENFPKTPHSTPSKEKQNEGRSLSRDQAVRRKATHHTGWVPSFETVTVAGYKIGGMVYVGTPPCLNDYDYWNKCRAYIDPSLPVARSGTDRSGIYMSHWPNYSEIPLQCRSTYLQWLENGRSDASYDPGYMFLYFYGLERRFVLEQPPEPEKREILEEVRRLKNLYSDNESVQWYLGEFIQFAQISLDDMAVHKPIFDFRGRDLPLSLKVVIGARIGVGDLLSADWALSWLICHPEYRLRAPSNRCPDEFHALFRIRFAKRFPKGLKVNIPRKMLKITYQAASNEFQGQLEPLVNGSKVPDISRLRRPVNVAQEIADEVARVLDKLSRYLGRNPNGRNNLEAEALLPQELWGLFPSDELEQLGAWAASIVANGGLVPVVDIIGRIEGAKPEKLGKRNLMSATDLLARVGFGFAPDPRFALRSPKIDEPVVLFELGEAVTRIEDVSAEYRVALIEIALKTFVTNSDGQITEAERKSLFDKTEDIGGVSEQERRRLAANLEWMLAVPPDMAMLRRKLRDTGSKAQASIRSALIAAAQADGTIQSGEVAGIEKFYKAMGLDPALVYSDLHVGDVSDGLVRVRVAEARTAGEAIPADIIDRKESELDTVRIAAIQSDTARVSSILGEIFDNTPNAPESPGTKADFLVGLDEKHVALVKELITQENWTEEVLREICSRSGLLISGAIENINEWAFETYDEALLEEYDGYEVTPDIADKLKKKFAEEISNAQIETS